MDQGSGESGDDTQPGFMENLERVLRMGQDNPQPVDLQDYEEDILIEDPELTAEASATPSAERSADSFAGQAASTGSLMDDYARIMSGFDGVDRDIVLTEGDGTDEPIRVIDLDQEEGTDYFEIVKDFDAGTAVVYSAIINRLDY